MNVTGNTENKVGAPPKGQGKSRLLSLPLDYATERKGMEEALRLSKESFSNIIQRNADGIIIVGRDGLVRFVNPAAEALFGRKADELVGEMFALPLVAVALAFIFQSRLLRQTADVYGRKARWGKAALLVLRYL